MRGITTYHNIISDIRPCDTPKTAKRQGRSAELIDARNRLLIHRFYYKTRVQRKMYPNVVTELSAEHHLSDIVVQRIIQNESTKIQDIKRQAPTVKYFRENWPFLIW